MGEASEAMIDMESPSNSPRLLPKSTHPKVMLVPLVFIIFYEVSGGPFGIEDSVKAGGPMLAIAGFLIFPFLWSIPEALITVEMGTMFPENGGYVLWVTNAFGPFWGFQVGWWKWLSGVIDNALYPVLFLDYLKFLIPAVGGGPIRVASVIIITVALTYMNYRGLTIVGWAATFLGIFSLLPFLVMAVLGLPHLKPARWLSVDWPSVKWTTYLNTLFWNLNYWDSVSALVGEVDQPHKTLPKAMYFAVVLVVVGYLVPVLAGTGAVDVSLRERWKDGYFASVATTLGGRWLGWWLGAAAALSNMGMFEAEMSSDSFQLLGMAEKGMLPSVFASRSSHGTPSLGIAASAAGVLLLSWMSFQEIIAAENYLYCFGMLVEFAAFIWLRMHRADKPRPYKVGLGTFGCACMCIPPTLLLILVMVIASWKVIIISFVTALVGFAMYPFLGLLKRKNWVDFLPLSPEFVNENTRHGNEAAVGLLRDQK